MPFTGGPSVRVDPNVKVEIRWIADFVGDGKVELFDNPDGTGTPIDTNVGDAPANDHTLKFNVGGLVVADTKYHVKVTHRDPTGNLADLTNPTPLPPVFTGAQAIGTMFADVDVDSAVISWTANVIGLGRVDYGTAVPDELATTDQLNIEDHSIALSGLSPGTTYQFRVSNRHAIDGGSLVERVSSLTTLSSAPPGVRLTQPTARPRVIYPEDVATLSVRVRNEGTPVPNIPVHFAVNGTAAGDAISDASGKATIWMQGVTSGLLRVEVSSPDAGNRVIIPVVVRRF